MDILIELLKITLPAALVLYAMYLTTKSFLAKEFQEKRISLEEKRTEVHAKLSETSLTIRLQAYERMALFLERISPPQLIPRINNPSHSVASLQQSLVQEIRDEFAYNLSQQIYLSNEVWILTQKAMEETILLINNSTAGLDSNDVGLVLAKNILENAMQHEINPTQEALDFLKEEARQWFLPQNS